MEEIDLSASVWFRFESLKGKWHFCPRELVLGLTYDLTSRGMDDLVIKPCAEGALDLPGIVCINRTWQDLNIEGIKFEVPTTDFAFFALALAKLPLRKFHDGVGYYKLHGWLHCLVLTELQRANLTIEMDRRLLDVKKQGDIEEDRLLEGIQKAVDAGHIVSDRVAPTPVSKRPN